MSGCTNQRACNYQRSATDDDGSCWYAPQYYGCNGECLLDKNNNGVCDELERGCTDREACNYNSLASTDDGSCTYKVTHYDCDGKCVVDTDGDGVCDPLEIFGCTNQDACDYDSTATEGGDELCTFPLSPNHDCDRQCLDDFVLDCSGDGDCCPKKYVGDGYADCEDQAWGCNLSFYDNDGGDCKN